MTWYSAPSIYGSQNYWDTSGADLSTKDELHQGLINLGINNILIPEKNGGLGLDLLFASAVSQSLGEGIATLPFVGPYVIAPIAIKYGAVVPFLRPKNLITFLLQCFI